VYLALCLVVSLKSLDVTVDLLVFMGMPLTHLSYGIGFLRGLVSRRMKEQ
jgi:hypothetical protein